MGNIDLDKPEQIRNYLRENMSEGYLSDEEGLNIDKFVDRYKQLLELSEKFEDKIRSAQEAKVQ